MSASGRYDGNLQMFVDEAREPDLARLAFLRWLGEGGRLEHEVFGPAAGEVVGPPEGGDMAEEAARQALAR